MSLMSVLLVLAAVVCVIGGQMTFLALCYVLMTLSTAWFYSESVSGLRWARAATNGIGVMPISRS